MPSTVRVAAKPIARAGGFSQRFASTSPAAAYPAAPTAVNAATPMNSGPQALSCR